MSLNSVMATATSGMIAAQTGIRVTSDNIANVNTPGYARKRISQSNQAVGGMGAGVSIDAINRVTDRFLQAASLYAASASGRAGIVAEGLDNAQVLFGDPTGADGTTSYFSRLDDIYAAFSAAADSPSAPLLRDQALQNVNTFLSESDRITAAISQLGKDADSHINGEVDQINDLLKQIDGLNTDITRATVAGGDATGSQSIQSGLVDQLSQLMDIQVAPRANGGVTIRSNEGYSLAGEGPATLSYSPSPTGNSAISIIPARSSGPPKTMVITGGEVKGLLDLRNTELPNMSDQLGELVSRAAEQLNAAANASSSVPAPTSLTGRDTGLDLETAVTGFTGQTYIALTGPNNDIQHRLKIDFDAGTFELDGGGPVGFDLTAPGDFLTQMNATLGGAATASFTNGALTVTGQVEAPNTTPFGVAFADDPAPVLPETAASKIGKGFSQFMGMNDLIRTKGYSPYETGMTTSDQHGFTPGGVITFRLTDANGGEVRDVEITIPPPPATTMQDLLDTLNAPGSIMGLYGQFSLGPKGEMTFASSGSVPVTLSVVNDQTQRGAGGPTVSALFGLGPAERASRGSRLTVNPMIARNSDYLPTAQLDLNAAAGVPALAIGDGRGALLLAKAGDSTAAFAAAGGAGAVTKTVSRYASDLSGTISRAANTAKNRMDAADSVQTEATNKRQSLEGVNIDEELVNLTTYQQAFNASARMIQAVKDMFDALLNMT
jgi:flagellar hook-associated protein 1 FlgK